VNVDAGAARDEKRQDDGPTVAIDETYERSAQIGTPWPPPRFNPGGDEG
jgi:hypothetical protein